MARKKSNLEELENLDVVSFNSANRVRMYRAKEKLNDDILFVRGMAPKLKESLQEVLATSRMEFGFLIDCAQYSAEKVNNMNAKHARGDDPTEQEINEIQTVVNTELEMLRVILRNLNKKK